MLNQIFTVVMLSTVVWPTAFHVVQTCGPIWEDSAIRLIRPMIHLGLSEKLVRSLMRISKSLPNSTPLIQQHLLLPVLAALPLPHADSASVASSSHRNSRDVAVQQRLSYHVRSALVRSAHLEEFARQVQAQVAAQLEEEGVQRKLMKCALDTLQDMDFGRHMLLGFTQEVLLSYACSEDEGIRKSAALAAWKVTERQWHVLRFASRQQLALPAFPLSAAYLSAGRSAGARADHCRSWSAMLKPVGLSALCSSEATSQATAGKLPPVPQHK